MRTPLLLINSVERILSTSEIESVDFVHGVNLLVGVPNTGKTKWIETIDYILGDSGDHPFTSDKQDSDGHNFEEKYERASVQLSIGNIIYKVERRWLEAGSKTKVFLNDESMSPKEFQHWLLEKLNIPLLHYPKGNPMSGQTWPELSFRSLLRHMYRRQDFWSDLVDKQPDAEKLASIQNFLGLADQIYTDDYGTLVKLKRELEKLEARRDQYLSLIHI